MLPERRQRRIVDLVREENGCPVTWLAERLDVSEATIRRDLSNLVDEGLVERSHGGAVPTRSATTEPSYGLRDVQNIDVKRALGRRVVEELSNDQAVCFDAGTTVIEVVRAIPSDMSLVAATNSPMTVRELVERVDDVRLIGGQLRGQTLACVGPSAEAFLDRIHFDVTVLGTNGIATETWFSTPNENEAAIKARMAERASTAIVVADGSKLTRRSLFTHATLSDVDMLVTDGVVDGDLRGHFDEAGISVVDDIDVDRDLDASASGTDGSEVKDDRTTDGSGGGNE